MDVNVVLYFHSLWNHPFLSAMMVVIANYGPLVSIATFVAVIISRRRAYGLLPWAAAGGAVAFGLDLLGGHLVVHARPFAVLHIAPLFPHPADNSFPSDHSAAAAYLAVCLWFVDAPAAWLATLTAAAVGIARVYTLMHWPVDVSAGWLIGVLPALAASLLWRKRDGSLAHRRGV